MRTALVAAGATHPGLRRHGNEDSGYVGRRLVVVADGMGGVEFGEVASAIVTHAVLYLDGPCPRRASSTTSLPPSSSPSTASPGPRSATHAGPGWARR